MKQFRKVIILTVIIMGFSLIKLDVKATLNTPTDKKEVIIAIIDTGIDYNHPDLKDSIWINQGEIPGDGIDNDGNGYIDDIYGWNFYNNNNVVCHYTYDVITNKDLSNKKDNDDHGTHVAGIIGAKENLIEGYKGLATDINVKIMILKINGGESGLGSLKSAVEAIKYATMMGADICNISWGTDVYSKEMEEVMSESNMLFVAAAGNTGTDNNSNPVYPASFDIDNLISVTFVDQKGKLTAYSNYGLGNVDIAAPGYEIKSTIVGASAKMSGTSMATPYITSIAARLYADNAGIFPQEVKKLILSNYTKLDNLKGYIDNPGIPDIEKILAKKDTMKKDIDKPKMTLTSKIKSNSFLINFKVNDKGDSGIRTIKYLIGKKTIDDFERGTKGISVVDYTLSLKKTGNYTFYISDYAGNENIIRYTVKDDKTGPDIQASYSISKDLVEKTISLRVKDYSSGVKRVKYLKGNKEVKDFLPANSGKEVLLKDNKGIIQVKKEGIYTIYAIDNRGNTSLKTINVKMVKADEIKVVPNRLTLNIDDEYGIKVYLKPKETTDKVEYSLSEQGIITIDKKGIIRAKKQGKVVVTAITSNGARAICEVIII